MIALLPGKVSGQVKYEREYRITPNDVPEEAREFIHQFPFKRQVRWYRNQYENSSTIEAKVRHNGRLYSIDFDQLGSLNDLEVEIKWKEIPTDIGIQITRNLDSLFVKHRIIRIQAQFCEEDIRAMVKNGIDKYLNQANFEIIVEGQSHRGKLQYEILFSEEGAVMRKEVLNSMPAFIEF